MQTKTTTTTPAPKPDAQPVQAATHTPGPWEKRDLRIQKGGNYIADCDASYMLSDEEKHGNARLIAAAPALLAALETIHEAGRISDQPRAVYLALIAQDALNAAGNREDLKARGTKGEALLAALDQCLPYVDRIRAMSGGDGDLTALTARAALTAAKGGVQ